MMQRIVTYTYSRVTTNSRNVYADLFLSVRRMIEIRSYWYRGRTPNQKDTISLNEPVTLLSWQNSLGAI